jgi:predicted nucleic acid-binding protein
MRPTPAPTVLAWLKRRASQEVCTTSITAAEIWYGIVRLPDGQRRETLMQAATEVFGTFADQVLPFDLVAAHAYADLVARPEQMGRPINGFDGQIAAICRARCVARDPERFGLSGRRG